MKRAAQLLLVCLLQLPAGIAFAQTKGISEQAAATTGKTDVAKEGFAKADAPPADDAEKAKKSKDATELSINAGGLFSTGNAKALSLTAGSKGRIRREHHQGSMAVALNYAAAPEKKADGTTGAFTETVRNVQGLVRYDYFVDDNFSIFGQGSVRHDKFQFLDLRVNLDPGVSYHFVNVKERRVWGEVGGDFQFDWRNPYDIDQQNIKNAAVGKEIQDQHQNRFNARAFFGYEEKATKEVGFTSGVEYLQGISQTDWFRLNIDLGLKSQISDKFAFQTTFTIRYESKPVAPEKLDVIGAVNLVYSLF